MISRTFRFRPRWLQAGLVLGIAGLCLSSPTSAFFPLAQQEPIPQVQRATGESELAAGDQALKEARAARDTHAEALAHQRRARGLLLLRRYQEAADAYLAAGRVWEQ